MIGCKIDEPTTYYYGLEESERGLPGCAPRQACSALLQRYWRAPALVRLCRCGRRLRCPASGVLDHRTVELNNRSQFKFCQPTTNWPMCSPGQIALISNTTFARLDPDELEELHHQNVHLTPAKITFNCRCRQPNYWKFHSTSSDLKAQYFTCQTLPNCRTGDICGTVRADLHSLYQTCLCPRHHICVHNGGVTYINMSELLYRGKGRQAYCQRVSDDYDEDYYYDN
ncbi:hypothetical protein JYU34_021233 [Plutella xylostella]|uniref:Uncharacterized protein n=1 Tax=Plutella xylostella TaxID=51655 RepID=A0ABQ7PTB3_PLUXY|nr:hypothetical protein JYU34_021233 [Plutella xylostella]